jgi:sarcosine oxidase
MSARPDVAVVGAGIVGLATADALVRAGLSVRVLERSRPGAGQSGGHTRIFRHGHEDERLVALAARSLARWRAWEERFGCPLVRPHGVLAAGPAVAERLALLRRAGVPARLLAPDEQLAALGLLGRPFAGDALLDEAAGPIDVRAALGALAAALGERVVQADVLAVRPTRAGTVQVVTPEGIDEVGACVVCAGQDTARLARTLGVELEVALSCHLRATFALREPAGAPLACLLDGTGEHGERVYGSPFPDGAHYAVGLSGQDPGARADGTLEDVDALAELPARLAAYVTRALPGLDPRPVGLRSCWVTELPWSGDGIAARRHGGILLLAGQNLFKHAPELGELLARAVLDGGVPAALQPEARLGAPTSASSVARAPRSCSEPSAQR